MTVASSGTSVELVDEVGALGAKRLDDVAIVDDLLAHVDGVWTHLQRQLDDVDGAVDARAEAARPSEDDLLQTRGVGRGFHHAPSIAGTRKPLNVTRCPRHGRPPSSFSGRRRTRRGRPYWRCSRGWDATYCRSRRAGGDSPRLRATPGATKTEAPAPPSKMKVNLERLSDDDPDGPARARRPFEIRDHRSEPDRVQPERGLEAARHRRLRVHVVLHPSLHTRLDRRRVPARAERLERQIRKPRLEAEEVESPMSRSRPGYCSARRRWPATRGSSFPWRTPARPRTHSPCRRRPAPARARR